MGNISTHRDIQDMEIEDDESYDEDENFFNTSNDLLSENYLVLVMRHLVESGELQMLTHNENTEQFNSLPVIKKKPNLDVLKRSDVYQTVKEASGYGSVSDRNLSTNFSLLKMLNARQRGALTQPEKCKINNLFIPNRKDKTLIRSESKFFCGSFSRDGKHFVTANQDHRIRLYDATNSSYRLVNEMPAKDVSWSILDVAFSPDGDYFAYSTWSMCMHICRLSDSNINCLQLSPESSRLGIFSLAFSNDGNQILGGGSDGCLYGYDRVTNRRTLRVRVSLQNSPHVNAVGFLDDSSQIFYSGLDDGNIKIWDSRCLNEARPEPAGLLIGHLDGITYIDSKNDGRHLISNSKDQSIKLWDLRVFSPKDKDESFWTFWNDLRYKYSWDYRWDTVPKDFYSQDKPIEGDTSIMTYRGHRVLKTLTRAKFSPIATTGQRYIYTGCATGRVVIYDVLTGEMVQAIEGHKDVVRDVAWHPTRQEILTSSWDFNINLNTFSEKGKARKTRRYIARKPEINNRMDTDSNDPPLRRSVRIAQRQNLLSND